MAFNYPLWVLYSPAQATATNSPTGSTHQVQDPSGNFLVVFSTDAKALQHATDMGIVGYRTKEVPDETDFRITLGYYKGRGGTHVSFDPDIKSGAVLRHPIDAVIAAI